MYVIGISILFMAYAVIINCLIIYYELAKGT